jgi:hypothetical protein
MKPIGLKRRWRTDGDVEAEHPFRRRCCHSTSIKAGRKPNATSRNFLAQQSDDLNRADESYGNCVKRCSRTKKGKIK